MKAHRASGHAVGRDTCGRPLRLDAARGLGRSPDARRATKPTTTPRPTEVGMRLVRAAAAAVVDIEVEVDSRPGKADLRKRLEGFKVAVYSTRSYMRKYFEESLVRAFPDSAFFTARLDKDTASMAEGFDAVCLFVNDQCDEQTVEKLAESGVKIIAMRCAGYDRIDLEACKKHGLKIVRVPTYSPESVAEHAVALVMALNRKVHLAYNRIWQGNYTLSGLEGAEICKKTVGVIGTGAIGTCFCAIMTGFGCKVLASDIRPNPRCQELGVEYVPLEELLAKADIVSLHCPLLPSTFHLIDKDRMVLMKPSALLINVSRGGLVDSSALLDAIEEGHIGGCAMDVYENEGNLFFQDFSAFTPRDRLRSWDRRFAALKAYPNVLITPHCAFLTHEALESIAQTTMQNLIDFATDQELVNAVKL